MKRLIGFGLLLTASCTYAQTAKLMTVRFVDGADSLTPAGGVVLEGFSDNKRQYDWMADETGRVRIDVAEIDPAYAPTEFRTRGDAWEKTVILPAQLEEGEELVVYLHAAPIRLMEVGSEQSIGGLNKNKFAELEVTPEDMQRYRELLEGKMAIPEQAGKQVSLRDWEQRLVKELKYPKALFFADIQGRLALEFELNAEGKVVFLKLKDPTHPALALEAARVLTSTMPVSFAGDKGDYPLEPGKRYLLPFRYAIVEAE